MDSAKCPAIDDKCEVKDSADVPDCGAGNDYQKVDPGGLLFLSPGSASLTPSL
jgi:hypothetical protein